MSKTRRISFSFSGVQNDAFHDGELKIYQFYAVSQPNTLPYSFNNSQDYTSYNDFYSENKFPDLGKDVVAFNFEDQSVNLKSGALVTIPKEFGLGKGIGHSISIYKREYSEDFVGEYLPAILTDSESGSLYLDFNIDNFKKYQYVIYSSNTDSQQQIKVPSDNDFENTINPTWEYWNIVELRPQDNFVNTPTIKKTYEADLDNMWIFKFNVEDSTQEQNIATSTQDTLGKYPRIGRGLKNYITSSISCYLGSEIMPCTGQYIERMRQVSRGISLSTNERAMMLKKWRQFVYSSNPKLIRDVKGQSWIVSITNSSNTTKSTWRDQPDTINFSWVELESTDNVVIYAKSSK